MVVVASYRPAEGADAESISDLVQAALLPHTLPGWTADAVAHLYSENSPQALRERRRYCRFHPLQKIAAARTARRASVPSAERHRFPIAAVHVGARRRCRARH